MKESKQIALWKKHYSSDQENLYKNFFIRSLFDLGHTYIAKHSNKNGNILDVGSGMGYHLKFEKLSNKRTYICLDNDASMLSKIKGKHIKTIVGTASKIPLPNYSVDVIIASHILEHLPHLAKDLKEIKRVLKSDGRLVVVLPCDPGFLWRMLTYISPSRWRLKKIGIDYDVVMRHEHVNEFRKCHKALEKEFTIVHESYYPLLIPHYHANILNCLTLVPNKS